MKIKLNDPVKNIAGKNLKEGGKNITIKDLLLAHLLNNKSNDMLKSLTIRRLGEDIFKKDTIELKADEVKLLKEVVAKNNPSHTDMLYAPIAELFS